jgi:hypothetical protein
LWKKAKGGRNELEKKSPDRMLIIPNLWSTPRRLEPRMNVVHVVLFILVIELHWFHLWLLMVVVGAAASPPTVFSRLSEARTVRHQSMSAI